jgi:hypothetical protein
MNLRQPFEHLIAGKLKQLPTPEADESWQQMKRLLDDEDRRGGAGKRPPGNSGWWKTGMLAIILLAGIWLLVEKTGRTDQQLAKKAAPVSTEQQGGESVDNNHSNNKNNTIAENSTPLTNSNSTNNTSGQPAATSNNLSATTTGENNIAPSAKNSGGAANTATALNNEDAVTSKGNNAPAKAGIEKNKTIDKATGTLSSTGSQGSWDSNKTGDQRISPGLSLKEKIPGNKSISTFTGDQSHLTTVSPPAKNKKSKSFNVNMPAVGQDGAADADAAQNGNNSVAGKSVINTREKTWLERLTGLRSPTVLTPYAVSPAVADSLNGQHNPGENFTADTKKMMARAQRDNAAAIQDKKDSKKLHLNLSNLFKPFSLRVDADPWWAAGLALNGSVPVKAQNRFGYNVNGKSSFISDYIPSPYLQFHLNNYVYLQTEINLITPQYTPQLLVYRQNNEIGAQAVGMSRQKSIYIEKLYYFNWPFSLHYSPVSNVYLSAGIQFSSFQSGLASIVEKRYDTQLGPDHASATSNSNLLKFKDDSIAAKIAPNEWRWQLGAEYYWNRFSVGVRYNQAFKNAINTVPSPLLLPTINRNRSLQFVVRYNLFDSRKANGQK